MIQPEPGRILLFGSNGQVGTAVTRLASEVVALSRSDVDLSSLTRAAAAKIIETTAPEMVINCAAYTAVDRAESEEELANRINGEAVGVLAEVTGERSIPLVTYSSDYVFSGIAARPYVESDRTDPVNAYGRSKLIGEQLALAANPLSLVVRTSWVISGTHRNFVVAILERAARGRVRVVNDQHGCPTVAADLAAASLAAATQGAAGLLHLTNTGPTTWYELAREAVKLAGIDPDTVEPCSTNEFPTPAARPAYSVLDSERRSDLGLCSLPEWRDSLPEVIADLSTNGLLK